jgi:hypothetical protein
LGEAEAYEKKVMQEADHEAQVIQETAQAGLEVA